MPYIRILTPQQLLFEGQAESVTLPGTAGSFSVLKGHAPIISSLEKGRVVCRTENGDIGFDTDGGFVEVANDAVTVCME